MLFCPVRYLWAWAKRNVQRTCRHVQGEAQGKHGCSVLMGARCLLEGRREKACAQPMWDILDKLRQFPWIRFAAGGEHWQKGKMKKDQPVRKRTRKKSSQQKNRQLRRRHSAKKSQMFRPEGNAGENLPGRCRISIPEVALDREENFC